MVLIYIQQISTAQNLVQSAAQLARQLDKRVGVFAFSDAESDERSLLVHLNELIKSCNVQAEDVFVVDSKVDTIASVCERYEALFLFLQLSNYRKQVIQRLLNACRDLRIPYLLFRDDFYPLRMQQVVLPVNFLEEEVEKAQFASAFGRFCESEIRMLLANDYGTKALKNAERMQSLFEKFDFPFFVQKGTKDSFKIDKEAVDTANREQTGMVIVTASREYGLDDVLFGPKELHLVRRSSVPVLLVNPRGDLYALCD